MSKSDATKARIMHAAISEFTALSYRGVTLREVAREAGVTMGAIRYHFGSKIDLYRDTLAYLSQPYNTACRNALQAALPSGNARAIIASWLAAPLTHWPMNRTTLLLSPNGRKLCAPSFPVCVRTTGYGASPACGACISILSHTMSLPCGRFRAYRTNYRPCSVSQRMQWRCCSLTLQRHNRLYLAAIFNHGKHSRDLPEDESYGRVR